MSTEQQDTTYLSEAVEAAMSEYTIRPSERIEGAIRKAIEAAESFFATHYEQKGAEGERGKLRKALDALEVAALGGYEERLMPEDTVADPYEARKLVAVTQDYSGEYSCHWTPDGIDFIRSTIEELRAALEAPDQPQAPSGPSLEDIEKLLIEKVGAKIDWNLNAYEFGAGFLRRLADRKLAEHPSSSDPAEGQVKLGDIARGVEAMARREYEVHHEETGDERVWEEETQGHRNIFLDAALERLTIALAALTAAFPEQPEQKEREW